MGAGRDSLVMKEGQGRSPSLTARALLFKHPLLAGACGSMRRALLAAAIHGCFFAFLVRAAAAFLMVLAALATAAPGGSLVFVFAAAGAACSLVFVTLHAGLGIGAAAARLRVLARAARHAFLVFSSHLV